MLSQRNYRPRAIIGDTDPGMRVLLRRILAAAGYETCEAPDEHTLLATLTASAVDVCIVSSELARGNFGSFLHLVRKCSAAPILWLVDSNATQLIAALLETGADDCLTAPFTEMELIVRLQRALRQALEAQGQKSIYAFDGIEIDLSQHRVRRNGQELHLSRGQYEVLRLLVEADGAVINHETILAKVWGSAELRYIGHLRRTIVELRRKLEPNPAKPQFIVTAPRVGYRLRTRPSSPKPILADNTDGSVDGSS
jgi:two-component system KDP operon response regulator KdpE